MKLYPWQTTGVEWLARRRRALLADDMGLGKSITAIRAAVAAGAGTVLVLAPTVVAYNWQRELQRWAPGLTVGLLTAGHHLSEASAHSVVVCTHGLTINTEVFDWLRSVAWGLVVVDEAHFFRNEDAKRTRALYGTGGILSKAERIWLLTGTPMPNHAGELWPMLRGVWPDRCAYSFEQFRDKFCALRWDHHRNDWKIVGNKKETLPDLRAMLDGVVLRRRKKDVLRDLPPIRWETVALPQTYPVATMFESLNLDRELRRLLEGKTPEQALDAL